MLNYEKPLIYRRATKWSISPIKAAE